MSGFGKGILFFFLFSLAAALFHPAVMGDVAYIIKRPSGDRGVSIVFSHDPEVEEETIKAISEDGHILLWQIQCAEKNVFYRPFRFNQGRMSVRPVLCLEKKYFCEMDDGTRGFVYQGYLFLDRSFDLHSPIGITLADKTIQAIFIQNQK